MNCSRNVTTLDRPSGDALGAHPHLVGSAPRGGPLNENLAARPCESGGVLRGATTVVPGDEGDDGNRGVASDDRPLREYVLDSGNDGRHE
jgi:hypothetical protein